MMQMDEAALDSYIQMWMYRRLSRRMFPFFRGTVKVVLAPPGQASGPPWYVKIQRVGESTIDGNLYTCLVPEYRPQVGDEVDLVWRDDTTAYVFGPLNGPGFGTAFSKPKVFPIVRLVGGFPKSTTFTPSRADSIIKVTWDATMFVTVGPTGSGILLQLDGNQIDQTTLFFNQTGVHMALPVSFVMFTAAAVQHTLTVVNGGGASTNADDYAVLCIEEWPV